MHTPHAYRGFTLIELIATITIIAILASVGLPRLIEAPPFAERGYADTVAASLRQARAVAVASTCDVEFTVDATGFRALQRAASGAATGPPCAAVGAFVTPVFSGVKPSGVAPAVNRAVIFRGSGLLTGATTTINLGPQVVTVYDTGVVQGP